MPLCSGGGGGGDFPSSSNNNSPSKSISPSPFKKPKSTHPSPSATPKRSRNETVVSYKSCCNFTLPALDIDWERLGMQKPLEGDEAFDDFAKKEGFTDSQLASAENFYAALLDRFLTSLERRGGKRVISSNRAQYVQDIVRDLKSYPELTPVEVVIMGAKLTIEELVEFVELMPHHHSTKFGYNPCIIVTKYLDLTMFPISKELEYRIARLYVLVGAIDRVNPDRLVRRAW